MLIRFFICVIEELCEKYREKNSFWEIMEGRKLIEFKLDVVII